MQAHRSRSQSLSGRHLLALAIAASIALAAPALAQANSAVSYAGDTLDYTGENGVNNTVTISLNAAADTYTITDSEAITAGTGCTGAGPVTCAATTPQDDRIDAVGADGNDSITVDTSAAPAASQPESARLGSSLELGNDRLDLSKFANPFGRSDITGGPGTDVEIAAPGGTEFAMGVAPDGTNDEIDGGPGPDAASYRDRTANVTVNAADGIPNDGEAGENDNISAAVEELDSGTGNDKLTAGPFDSRLDGDAGNNTLIGGPGSDSLNVQDGNNVLRGGAGDDSLFAGNGVDVLDGGPGDDFLETEFGPTDFHGGDGIDFAEVFESGPPPGFAPVNVSVTLDDLANDGASGEGKNVHSDIEDIETGDGNDTVVASNLSNSIFTGRGRDIVTPLGGSDMVSSGAGDDAVAGRDGVFDRIGCGDGTDSVTVDNVDQLSACESVSSAPVPPPPGDTQAPRLTITRLASRVKRGKFLKSGISMRVAPSEPVRLVITLTGHARGARIARSGDLVVATKTLGMSGARRTVRLRAPRSLRRRFARRFKLSLEVLAIDRGGNLTRARRSIRVR